jgi:hypothetical protein
MVAAATAAGEESPNGNDNLRSNNSVSSSVSSP